MVEVCRYVFQVFELRAAMGAEMINLHRLASAYFTLVCVAINASFSAILGNLVKVMCSEIDVGIKLSRGWTRIRLTASQRAEELRLYRL